MRKRQHKLDMMCRAFGQYPSVLIGASTKYKKVVADYIYIVDRFAGAGLHLSANHPDGTVPGTALQACYRARKVQRKYPGSRVHVRLINLNEDFCTNLVDRTAKFRDGVGVDHVDVRVVQGSVIEGQARKLQGISRPAQ